MMKNSGAIDTAIILVAGRGSRLAELTGQLPKPLIDVGGKPLIVHALENFGSIGVRRAVLVTGYLHEKFREELGTALGPVEIEYIYNESWATTNNVSSVYLARSYLDRPAYLLEGDVVFERSVISTLSAARPGESLWAMARFEQGMDGSMSTADESGRITSTQIIRDDRTIGNLSYKSVGLLRLHPPFLAAFLAALEQNVQDKVLDVYYDLVIAGIVRRSPIYVCDVTGARWAEIDDRHDLEMARGLFA